MCLPALGATQMMGLSLASSALQYQSQRSYANAQEQWQQSQYEQDMAYRDELNEYQMEQYLENADRAHEDVRRNYKEINERIGEESVTAALEINDIFRQSRSLQTTLIAQTAERNVEGRAVDYLLDNIKANELRAVGNIKQEQEWRLGQYMSTMEQIEAQGNARVEGMNPQPIAYPSLPQPVQQPNFFASMMNGFSNGINLMNQFQGISNLNTTQPPAVGGASNLYPTGGQNTTSGGYGVTDWT